MKFYIKKLILWLQNGQKRELLFKDNKINVITGESGTGKSAILDIIDYCLLSSTHSISENIINENVIWYGLKLFIDDEVVTIARRKPTFGRVSDEFYFDSMGNEPKIPQMNINKYSLKRYLDGKFGINCEVKMPYGGAEIKAGSRISFRYFLMFNTISQDIITDTTLFFDKQSQTRYREALPRIFDLAVGIDTVYNILCKEQKEQFEAELKRLDKKKNLYDKKKIEFEYELERVIKQAKEYNLIKEDVYGEKAIQALKKAVDELDADALNNKNIKYRDLSEKIFDLKKKIQNIELFVSAFDKYKCNLNKVVDSLKPIEYLKDKSSDILKTSIFEDLITIYENDIKKIKSSISKNAPISIDTYDILDEYRKDLEKYEKEMAELPEDVKFFRSDLAKYIFIGQIKAKIDLYLSTEEAVNDTIDKDIATKKLMSDALLIDDISEKKDSFLAVLNFTIKKYMDYIKESLENYQDYMPVFDYQKKKLNLRAPKSFYNEPIGSSSNHMFLHLLLFLALQDYIQDKKISFVPSFLIIDQFSRPYYPNSTVKTTKDMSNTDQEKVRNAIRLLNKFIANMNDGIGFQVILFEHIEKESFNDFDNFYLVEEFRGDNALIRPQDRS